MDGGLTADASWRLLDFVERTSDLVGVLDEHGRVTYMNEAARKRLGFADLTGLTASDFFDPGTFERYYDEIRPTLLRSGVWTGDVSIRTHSGEAIPMSFELVADVRPGGEIRSIVAHGRTPVETATARDRTHRRVGLVHVTVRDVDDIVSAHGQFVTDGMIRAIERRLTLAVRTSDAVARIERDAFVVVLEDVRDVAEVLRHAQALHDAFEREPVWTAVGEVAVQLELRPVIGDSGEPFERLLARADRDPSAERRPATELEGDESNAAELRRTSEELRLAVMRGEIRTHVVPLVGRTGELAGYEAFARWSRPSGAIVEAAALYDLADRVRGARSAIDLRVLREVAAVAATSPATTPLGVYAPVGASLLDDVYVEQYVWEIADATGLSAGQIHLLVDRALVADGHPKTRDTLQSLRDNGCALVVTGVDETTDVDALVGEAKAAEVWLADDAVGRCLRDDASGAALEQLVVAAHRAGARVIVGAVATAEAQRAALGLGADLTTGTVVGGDVPAHTIV